MSFNTSWNMAVAFIENRADDFRRMWREFSTDEKIPMPDLQQRLSTAVDRKISQALQEELHNILFDTMRLSDPSPQKLGNAPADLVNNKKIRQLLAEFYLQGVNDAENIIEEHLKKCQ